MKKKTLIALITAAVMSTFGGLTAVYCNEKGMKKCVEIDFFGAAWYNKK